MATPEMQRTQMMIAEQMNPTAIRYDEIYYPRTDKRAISKSKSYHLELASVVRLLFLTCVFYVEGNQYTYEGNEHQE